MAENQIHIHAFRDTVIPSTCRERGYTLHKCDCGYEHKDSFTPLGDHDYQVTESAEATCTEDGYRKTRCTVCGEEQSVILPALKHDFSEWTTQKFATCTESGTQVRVCKRCNAVEEQDLPPKGHAPQVIKDENGKKVYFCKNCGEIIHVPSLLEKVKRFLVKHKKPLVITLSSVIAVVALVLAAVNFLIPQFHYSMGKQQIKKGNYASAFSHFMSCWDYRDTEDFLKEFVLITETEVEDSEIVGGKVYTQKYRYAYEGRVTMGDVPRCEYDDHGNVIEKIYYSETGEISSRTEYRYEYDIDGKLLWEYGPDYKYEYYPNGEVKHSYHSGTGTSGRYEYEYDEQGNRIKYIEYKYDTLDAIETHEIYENEYDQAGNLICVTTSSNGVKTRVQKFSYYKDGTHKEEYVYNADGVLIKKVEYHPDGEMKLWISYDAHGNVNSERKYYKDGTIKTVIGYDQDGKVTQKAKYYSNGNLKTEVVYRDADGTIYKKGTGKKSGEYTYVVYDEEGKVSEKSERDAYGSRTYLLERDSSGAKRVYSSDHSYDKYGRMLFRNITHKSYGTEFPESMFPEMSREKVTYEYVDLEVRYMPDYGA